MDIFLQKEYENFIPAEYKSAISSAADIAQKNRIKLYIIGGVVRDLILNNSFKDVDIAVEFDALCFANILKSKINCKIISVQENLKTVKIEFENGVEIDFASTREEMYKSDGVLPEAFNFGCELKLDVKRRDFTINTLAVSLFGPDKFKLIDYFNGYSDLKNKVIKILHKKSFIDDPSRIIRALKFMLRLDFSIDRETKMLMDEYLSERHENIPLERVKNELFQYLSIPKNCLYKYLIDYKVYKLFTDNPILLFNENDLHKCREEDKKFILFAFLVLNSDFEQERYNLTSKEKKVLSEVKWLINHKLNENDDFEIYKKYNKKQELAIKIYYLITKDESVIKYQKRLSKIRVKITGRDLIELGYKPSKIFVEIFESILKEKLKGKIKTKEEEIEYIKKMKR